MTNFSLTKRQSAILRAVNACGTCTISDLATQLKVSEETIRRDTRQMEKSALLRKLHGRISLPEQRLEPPLQRRMTENMEAKQRIGEATAELITEGSSVILDPGSTTNYVARAMCERTHLNVITNSTEIARVFMSSPGIYVYLAGGEMRHEDSAAFGPTTLEFLRCFAVETAVLSVGAIDAERGLMDFDLKHMEYSRFVMELAERVIVVADQSKFGVRGLATVSGLDRMDILVTDTPPNPPFDNLLAEAAVQVIVAS